MSAEVIAFPKNKIKNSDGAPNSIEEIQENMDSLRKLHVEEALLLVGPMLFDQLAQVGFDFDSKDGLTDKSSVFVFEAIHALLSKYYGLEHPFHKLSEEYFLTTADGSIKMVAPETQPKEKDE